MTDGRGLEPPVAAPDLTDADFTFQLLERIFTARFGESAIPPMRHKSFKLTPEPPAVSGNAFRTLTICGVKVLRRVSEHGTIYSWTGTDGGDYKISRFD